MGEFVFIDPYQTFSEKDLSYKVEKAKEQTEKEDKKDNNDHKSAKQQGNPLLLFLLFDIATADIIDVIIKRQPV